MKKFELTSETIVKFGRTLHRIRALIDFSTVKAGETGGFVEKEANLLQYGNAWVSGNARVYGDARVYGNARVSDNAEVSGNTWVSGDAWVYGNAKVSGNARVYGDARVYGNADFLLIGRIGSRAAFTTFFKDKTGGIQVACGCFLGSIAEFRAKVEETHGDNKHAKMYNLAADMAELQILGGKQ